MVNWEERRLIVKVANLYYFEGRTQAQIAKAIGVSRPVISKLLHRAKEEGIVEVYIKDENAHTVELEKKLEKKYDLKEVIVVPTRGLTPEMIKRSIGKATSFYISKKIKSIRSLGISWGRTISSFVQEYPYEQVQDLKIVPLVGGMGREFVEIHSNLLAYQLAKKMSCNCSYLYAPAMVETEGLKERLVQSEDIANVLLEGQSVDLAIVGIGNPFDNSTMIKMGYLKEEDLQTLKKVGAVGDIGSQFIDISGKPISHPLNNKVIGLQLEQLKNIPNVIGIIEGKHKVDSLKATLKGNYLDVVIMDDQIANQLSKNIS
ncbi:sugar-binding transcriptional regulator [Alkalihalobacillus sp. BA299]|uniref:sugar-binding transcriptional regulator n=1 Tax=Alkalihalobacillus sp. BA299 TaxID=2815938 RepID=UPI001ADA4C00|nr:sugar-binding transcriptional regulator [Alkalihalobacillus sp. BA299]